MSRRGGGRRDGGLKLARHKPTLEHSAMHRERQHRAAKAVGPSFPMDRPGTGMCLLEIALEEYT